MVWNWGRDIISGFGVLFTEAGGTTCFFKMGHLFIITFAVSVLRVTWRFRGIIYVWREVYGLIWRFILAG